LFGGLAPPTLCLFEVFLYAFAGEIPASEIELGRRISALCGASVPFHGLNVILGYAESASIACAEVIFRHGMTLVGSAKIPCDSHAIVLLSSVSCETAEASEEFAVGVTAVCLLMVIIDLHKLG
jgi:hypothetical protein